MIDSRDEIKLEMLMPDLEELYIKPYKEKFDMFENIWFIYPF